MIAIVIALAEAAAEAKDYDESLRFLSYGLVAVALLYAIVATWMVTPKGDEHH